MSSFELKPMGATNDPHVGIGRIRARGVGALAGAIPAIDEVVFTHARLPPPPQLIGRVPEELWMNTYDAVRTRTAEVNEMRRSFLQNGGNLPHIICCVPCIIGIRFAQSGDQQKAMQASQLAWLKLVQHEQEQYAPYGVHVSLATEARVRTIGAAEHRRVVSDKVNVGLQFDMAPATGVVNAIVAAVPVAPTPEKMEERARGGSLADEIAKLSQLHDAGALTVTEFADAKAKLLSH